MYIEITQYIWTMLIQFRARGRMSLDRDIVIDNACNTNFLLDYKEFHRQNP